MNTVALIVAGGKGERFGGDIPKQFYPVLGRPLLSWTIDNFERAESIDEIAVVVPEESLLYAREKVVQPFGFKKVNRIIAGGESRQESVRKGLDQIPYATRTVAVHDGARPLVSFADIDKVVMIAEKNRAAILARSIGDTVKRAEGEFVISTLDRSRLYLAETPQVFQYDILVSAHKRAVDKSGALDDAMLVERLGFKVKLVVTGNPNPKITDPDDIEYLKYWLGKENETGN